MAANYRFSDVEAAAQVVARARMRGVSPEAIQATVRALYPKGFLVPVYRRAAEIQAERGLRAA